MPLCTTLEEMRALRRPPEPEVCDAREMRTTHVTEVNGRIVSVHTTVDAPCHVPCALPPLCARCNAPVRVDACGARHCACRAYRGVAAPACPPAWCDARAACPPAWCDAPPCARPVAPAYWERCDAVCYPPRPQ